MSFRLFTVLVFLFHNALNAKNQGLSRAAAYSTVLEKGLIEQPEKLPMVPIPANQFVAGGMTAKSEEVPWHAGIYSKRFQPFMQICGGSLVNESVVISAAHCFMNGRPQDFAVAVGKLYRPWNDTMDTNAQRSDISEIRIPPRYHGSLTNFQDDIALLIMATPFTFNNKVQPINLDFDYNMDNRQLANGNLGKVAGWGRTDANGNASPTLQVVNLPSVDVQRCFDEIEPVFRPAITSDKICAGNETAGTAVCMGDSGGGLSFAENMDGRGQRFYLRGVVSTAPNSVNNDLCNVYTYATFTHILKHEHFIRDAILAASSSNQRSSGLINQSDSERDFQSRPQSNAADPEERNTVNAQPLAFTGIQTDLTTTRPYLSQNKPTQSTQNKPTQSTQNKLNQFTQNNPTQSTQNKPTQSTQNNLNQFTQNNPTQSTQNKPTQSTQNNLNQFTQNKLNQSSENQLAQTIGVQPASSIKNQLAQTLRVQPASSIENQLAQTVRIQPAQSTEIRPHRIDYHHYGYVQYPHPNGNQHDYQYKHHYQYKYSQPYQHDHQHQYQPGNLSTEYNPALSTENQPIQYLENRPGQTIRVPPAYSIENNPGQTIRVPPVYSIENQPGQAIRVPPAYSIENNPGQTIRVPPVYSIENQPGQAIRVPPAYSIENNPGQTIRVPPVYSIENQPGQAIRVPPVYSLENQQGQTLRVPPVYSSENQQGQTIRVPPAYPIEYQPSQTIGARPENINIQHGQSSGIQPQFDYHQHGYDQYLHSNWNPHDYRYQNHHQLQHGHHYQHGNELKHNQHSTHNHDRHQLPNHW